MEPRKFSLIGIPDHQGVVNVGGRIGAAHGPAAFRKAFARLKGREGVHTAITDLGDVASLGDDSGDNLRRAADFVRAAHQSGAGRSIVVGGSHDHGYSHLLGLSEALSEALGAKARLGCINIDAHLDVRAPAPKITSGSPFHLALESGVIKPTHLVEFGIQSHCNAPELWEYVEKKKVSVIRLPELRHGAAAPRFAQVLQDLAKRCHVVVVSLDLDAIDEASAPGVSAPQAEGFSASDLIHMMEIAGAEPKTGSLGIFELNPVHDLGDRTARLAATAAYHFIASGIWS